MTSTSGIEITVEQALDCNLDERTISGLVVPFGEAGRTSVGRLVVGPGTISLPRDPSIISANFDHDRHRNVARATQLVEQSTGIFARFHVADTEDGDQLLLDISEGKRPGLSMELAPGSKIAEGGRLVEGKLTGAAITNTPAFPSAAVYASANYVEPAPVDAALSITSQDRIALHRIPALDESEPVAAPASAEPPAAVTPEPGAPIEPIAPAEPTPAPAPAPIVPVPGDVPQRLPDPEPSAIPAAEPTAPTDPEKDETEMTTATVEDTAVAVVPEGITASRPAAPAAKTWGTKREILGALKRKLNGTATPADRTLIDRIRLETSEIFAAAEGTDALDIIPFSGGSQPAPYDTSPQYLGELTELVYGVTAFADLAGSGDLTKPNLAGFHFGTLPTPGAGASSWSSPYAGNATQVPTALITTTPYTAAAKYFAGGIETPREWNLFGVDEALLGKYFDRQAQNFGVFCDEGVFTTITAALTAFDADNPSGITIGVGWSALVDALFAVIEQKGGLPTAAVVEPTLWKSMAKTSNIDAFQYLSAQLGFTDGQLSGFKIRPDYSGQLATGNILAGNYKAGATLYTLPGSPLRFQALNIGAGAAIDTAVMGAAAVVLEQAECFALVKPYGS
jgi:hypothetical protein